MIFGKLTKESPPVALLSNMFKEVIGRDFVKIGVGEGQVENTVKIEDKIRSAIRVHVYGDKILKHFPLAGKLQLSYSTISTAKEKGFHPGSPPIRLQRTEWPENHCK
jgi:hypothetical protein